MLDSVNHFFVRLQLQLLELPVLDQYVLESSCVQIAAQTKSLAVVKATPFSQSVAKDLSSLLHATAAAETENFEKQRPTIVLVRKKLNERNLEVLDVPVLESGLCEEQMSSAFVAAWKGKQLQSARTSAESTLAKFYIPTTILLITCLVLKQTLSAQWTSWRLPTARQSKMRLNRLR